MDKIIDKIPIVSSFCGCIDLKVACIVIAAIRLILSMFLFIVLLLLLFNVIEFERKMDEMGLEDNSSKLADLLISCKQGIEYLFQLNFKSNSSSSFGICHNHLPYQYGLFILVHKGYHFG